MHSATDRPGGSGWLLIAEDSDRLRTMLRRMLQSAGVTQEVVEVCSAEAALHELAQRPAPDLVILDVNMPGRTGLEILPTVRRHSPAAFIVVLTGLNSAEAEALSLARGANLYLAKDAGLATAVQSLLAHWRAAQDGAAHVAPAPCGAAE